VEINRPDKLNAFTEPMWLEMGQLFRQLGQDADVRAVVLSGAGERAFTTGLDVQAAQDGPLNLAEPDPARKARKLREHLEEIQGCVGAVEKCNKRECICRLFFSFSFPSFRKMKPI